MLKYYLYEFHLYIKHTFFLILKQMIHFISFINVINILLLIQYLIEIKFNKKFPNI